jgi:hypothetical protein
LPKESIVFGLTAGSAAAAEMMRFVPAIAVDFPLGVVARESLVTCRYGSAATGGGEETFWPGVRVGKRVNAITTQLSNPTDRQIPRLTGAENHGSSFIVLVLISLPKEFVE